MDVKAPIARQQIIVTWISSNARFDYIGQWQSRGHLKESLAFVYYGSIVNNLRYSVGDPTSSRNVAFHGMAFGFTQLTALAVLCKFFFF